jgi:hypothetical protein
VKIALIIFLLGLMFVAGIVTSPKIMSTHLSDLDWRPLLKLIEHWTNRYQTFLGVLVAIAAAYFTINAMGKQTAVSERQFLSSQLQGLMGDRANLQFVIAQLNESKMQRVLFEIISRSSTPKATNLPAGKMQAISLGQLSETSRVFGR